MPSDKIRPDEMTGDLGPEYLRGRRGAAGSDMGGQGFGAPGFGDPGEEPPRRSRLLPLVIAFFALAAFAGIVWYAYEWGVGDVEPEHLPVVQAQSGAIKEKPAEPGGLEVPYTDSAVLNRDGSQKPSRVESLLPPPEEPVAVPKAPEPKAPEAQTAEPQNSGSQTSESQTSGSQAAGSHEAAPAEGGQAGGEQHAEVPPAPGSAMTKPSELPELPKPSGQAAEATKPAETMAQAAPAPEPKAPAAQAPAAKAPESEAPAAKPAEQPQPEKAVEAPKPVAEAPAGKPVQAKEAEPAPATSAATAGEVKPGDWVIQLAALRKESEAEAAWSAVQAKHKDLLGSMALQLERADLGDRGVFYRVQTGPLPNRATALDLCAQLKAAGQACIAKKR